MLAVNRSIEAASAGDFGKGFVAAQLNQWAGR